MGRVDINHGVWVERGLAFASACFLVAASRVAFRGHYLREFATVLRAANISRASELASGWQKLKYVSVSETNLVKGVVGTGKWDKLRPEERGGLGPLGTTWVKCFRIWCGLHLKITTASERINSISSLCQPRWYPMPRPQPPTRQWRIGRRSISFSSSGLPATKRIECRRLMPSAYNPWPSIRFVA